MVGIKEEILEVNSPEKVMLFVLGSNRGIDVY